MTTEQSNPPLKTALNRTQQVEAEVHDVSQDLAVVHTVLDSKVSGAQRSGDVDQAIDKTEVLEKKLAESARTLTKVSRDLQAEVHRHDHTLKALGDKAEAVEQALDPESSLDKANSPT